jgi:hypothetical protein
MDRRLACLLSLLLLFAARPAAAQLTPRPKRISPTPAYFPRAVFLGTYVKGGAVTPQLRAQWQVTLIQERIDALVLIGEVGGGYAVGRPSNAGPRANLELVQLYQHTGLLGFGYRGSWPSGFHVGAHVLAGPLHYGAKYALLPPEKRTAGLVDGRLQVGQSVGPFVVGAAVGYGEVFGTSVRSNALQYLGGLSVGLFLDWR